MATATTTLQEEPGLEKISMSCPAFSDGCPYSNMKSSAAAAEEASEFKAKCPAFSNGCPFKNVSGMDDLKGMLSSFPEDHVKASGGNPQAVFLADMLKEMHGISVDMKQEIGKECPVFSLNKGGCPFKTVCSNGRPLVEELNAAQWDCLMLSNALFAVEENDTDGEAQQMIHLARELKDGTKESHKDAENVAFVKDFVKGKIDRDEYRRLLVALYHVYKTMEEGARANESDPVYGPVHFPGQLEREKTLEDDLEYFYGPDWRDFAKELTPATQRYVDRLKEIAATEPELIVAHCYTRYLGDLSGGRVLARVAKKALNLPEDGTGAQFYYFPNVDNPNKFKKMYRDRLDTLPVDAALADRIVAEANRAFVMNMDIFREFGGGAIDEVAKKLTPNDEAGAACPFAHLARAEPSPSSGQCPFSAVSSAKRADSNRYDVIWALLVVIVAVYTAYLMAL